AEVAIRMVPSHPAGRLPQPVAPGTRGIMPRQDAGAAAPDWVFHERKKGWPPGPVDSLRFNASLTETFPLVAAVSGPLPGKLYLRTLACRRAESRAYT